MSPKEALSVLEAMSRLALDGMQVQVSAGEADVEDLVRMTEDRRIAQDVLRSQLREAPTRSPVQLSLV